MQAQQREAQKDAEHEYDVEQEGEEQIEANMSGKLKERLGAKNVNRLLDLKLRMNEAKVQNSKAAV